VLRENKLMRELGEGMRRIFDAMHETDFERPALYSNGVWFSITLSRKSL
jgi:ATP-dependent DNA helicase RecG